MCDGLVLNDDELDGILEFIATRLGPDQSLADAFIGLDERTKDRIERFILRRQFLGIKYVHKAVLGILDKGNPARAKAPRVLDDLRLFFDGRGFS